jgi:hypothetical protein
MPTFNKPLIEGSFCEAKGGRMRRSESCRWKDDFLSGALDKVGLLLSARK